MLIFRKSDILTAAFLPPGVSKLSPWIAQWASRTTRAISAVFNKQLAGVNPYTDTRTADAAASPRQRGSFGLVLFPSSNPFQNVENVPFSGRTDSQVPSQTSSDRFSRTSTSLACGPTGRFVTHSLSRDARATQRNYGEEGVWPKRSFFKPEGKNQKHTVHEYEQRRFPSAWPQFTANWTQLIFCWNALSKWKLTVLWCTLSAFHHSVGQWKTTHTRFFPTQHITATKFYYFIRHLHLQWESEHQREFAMPCDPVTSSSSTQRFGISGSPTQFLRQNNPCHGGHFLI